MYCGTRNHGRARVRLFQAVVGDASPVPLRMSGKRTTAGAEIPMTYWTNPKRLRASAANFGGQRRGGTYDLSPSRASLSACDER